MTVPLPATPEMSDSQSVRRRADELIRALAGPEATLRDDQWTAVDALVVKRQRALVVQRTGWGKSAVYFIAARLLREAGFGATIIISPLLALMRNQVSSAERAGVRAATINSANMTEWDAVRNSVSSGEVDVLLVSPERLNNPEFRDTVLPSLAANAGLVVVDEAHCVSDWGHDFRPDYRRIRTLLADLPPGVPVLATTATANDRVVRDVAEQLGVGSDSSNTLVVRGGLDRQSLHLSVVDIAKSQQRAAWLVDQLGSMPGSGIVYCLTVTTAHDVAELLTSAGYAVRPYTGRTDAAERESYEHMLLNNDVKALVATSALGMGFDKPDMGFVVHLGAPPSPISYYQQIGRAGRAAERAEVVLLPGAEDRAIWDHFASLAFPDEQVVRRVIAVLDPSSARSTAALEPMVDLSRSRLETVLKVLDVDGAVRRVRGGWVATGHEWVYDSERYRGLADARRREQQAMLDYIRTAQCRMVFLRAQLDDPTLADELSHQCGRCDNCTGHHRQSTISPSAAEIAHSSLTKPGVELPQRKLWPTGLSNLNVPMKGKIASGPEPGRAIARLTDLGLGQQIRALLAGPDADVPQWLVHHCVEVLREWQWSQRPDYVIALASPGHHARVTSLARAIADLGRMEYVGEIHRDPARPPVTAHNSAFRVAQLWGGFQLPDALPPAGGAVLLVTDIYDTGWTTTVAACAVADRGATVVLPLAIAAAG